MTTTDPSGSGPGTRRRPVDVLGVGDTDVDVYVSVQRLPEPGEKIAGEHLGLHPGGVVANVCAATSRLGLATRLISRVGDDAFGLLARADLEQRGVDVGGIRVLPDVPTYLCLVHIDASGDKALVIARTPAMFPTADEVTDADLATAAHVHLAPFDLEAAIEIAGRARRAGASVSVDLEPSSMGNRYELVEELVAMVDVLLPNSHAVEDWLGVEASTDVARAILDRGPRLVAIGCGARGAILAADGEAIEVPAFEVPVRDTTGAGDAFNAGVLLGWSEGWELARTGRFATACAAHVIGDIGARSGQASRADVERLLRQRGAA